MTSERAEEVEIDLWVGVSRAMRGAVLDHRGSLPTRELRDYWQVPDANHGHLLAEAAIAHLRALPVARRMEAMGMEVRWTDSGPSTLFTEEQFAAIGDGDPHWSAVWVATEPGRVDDVPAPDPLDVQPLTGGACPDESGTSTRDTAELGKSRPIGPDGAVTGSER